MREKPGALLSTRRLSLRFGMRVLLAWAIACAAVFIAQRPLMAALLPFFDVVVGLLQRDFSATLRLVEDKGQAAIQMIPFLLRPVPLTEQLAVRPFITLPPLRVSVDHALVPLALLAAGIASWPFAGLREAVVRVLLAIAVLPLVLGLTTPVLLVGQQQVIFFEASLRRGAGFEQPGLVALMIFMETGGRWLLPLAVAVGCVVASHRICVRQPAAAPARASVKPVELVFPPA